MASLLSLTDIANQALSRLGATGGFIADIDTDDTAAGVALRRSYIGVRDEVLEAHPWGFAKARASIAASATAPVWGRAKAFLVPSDCLRVLSVEDDVEWEREGEEILTDSDGPLKVRYIKRITIPGQFSPGFVSVFVVRWAAEAAEAVTGSTTKTKELLGEYADRLAMVARTSAQEQTPGTIDDGEWLAARR